MLLLILIPPFFKEEDENNLMLFHFCISGLTLRCAHKKKHFCNCTSKLHKFTCVNHINKYFCLLNLDMKFSVITMHILKHQTSFRKVNLFIYIYLYVYTYKRNTKCQHDENFIMAFQFFLCFQPVSLPQVYWK